VGRRADPRTKIRDPSRWGSPRLEDRSPPAGHLSDRYVYRRDRLAWIRVARRKCRLCV